MEFKKISDVELGGTVTHSPNRNWKPMHTAMVYDKVSGMTLDQIAQKYGYKFSTIGNIMRTATAKRITAQIEHKILADGIHALPEAVKATKILAFQRIKDFLSNDEYEQKSPFAFFDRTVRAVDALDKLDTSNAPSSTPFQTQNMQLNFFGGAEKISELTNGLNAALEVSQRYEALPSETVDGSTTEFYGAKASRKLEEGARRSENQASEEPL